ncbi:MAG TPA: RNA polymerase sigma factor [Vicinamibacterales bacterium]|jgi:RNA polymerase sigma-70 factor (ECF subfamily)|nr:RNA polymerase sigma factor [Vicinamibacterales bacterium]
MDADERLQVEAAQKDPARFGELYERHFDQVYAFVSRRLRDRTVAEDVTAEVFHKALAALPGFRFVGAPFGSWLFRIAVNALADRSRRVMREVPGADGTPEPRVESDADASDRRGDLFRFVNELPADQRRVIIERFIEERSIRDIASRLHKTEGAVKQLQFRALHSLRTRMEGVNG